MVNKAKRQRILEAIFLALPELTIFVDTWYLDSSLILLYMDDHAVAITWSAQGVRQGPMSSFLFCIKMNPVLHQIEVQLKSVDNIAQVLATLDDIEMNSTEVLADINIQTVPRKSHFLFLPKSSSLGPIQYPPSDTDAL